MNLVVRRVTYLGALALALGGCTAAGSPSQQTGRSVVGERSAFSSSASLPTLRQGEESNDVAALQLLLRARGSSVPVDGRFGRSTYTAVRRVQARRGLPVDGVVGTSTWRVLTPTVGSDKPSAGQSRVAIRLLMLGGQAPATPADLRQFVDSASTRYDRAGVRAVQRRARVSVDGIVGPVTWGVLLTDPANREDRTTPEGTAVVVLRGDGLDIGTGPSATQLRFGSSPGQVRSALTAALGPLRTTSLPDCGKGRRTAAANGAFGVLLDGERFVGWTDQGRLGRRLKTDRGVGVGSTLEGVRRSYGDVTVSTTPHGPAWTSADGLSGLMSGRSAGSTLTVLSGGETCVP